MGDGEKHTERGTKTERVTGRDRRTEGETDRQIVGKKRWEEKSAMRIIMHQVSDQTRK